MSDFTVSASDADATQSIPESGEKENYPDTRSGDRRPALDARLTALERAVTDGETDVHTLADSATMDGRLDDLEARTSEIETRLDELDAAIQSLRGYVGAVRAVNREVERRADAALAAVDRLDDADDAGAVDLDLPDAGDSSEDGIDRTADELPADETTETPPDAGDGSDFADRVRDLL
ncbi:DUF7310 family coiled-coil domain-containing protein [Salinirubrum litoreum]|uniref:DUF7310 domain-containing protein n=1 Tax=Salinirubrum litoreum TaxID=1126234 RepID=A0ABD5RAN3_9EURY|nr:hypothetical protein [Salinirubrum litoreum]